jgi:hypothetical protein
MRDERERVFVFGSNARGRHGRGAALFAARWRGAVPGCAEGMQGQAYAVPTKDEALRTLPIERIAGHVATFLEFARVNPEIGFDVTRIGCGLAGHADEAIAPLFFEAPENCRLPWRWERMRNPTAPPRVIIAGSRGIQAEQFPASAMNESRMTTTPPVSVMNGAAT